MPALEEIRSALAAHEPKTLSARPEHRAAVALVLRENEGAVEVLFIERASREGDPWSGHMAFPGGRVAVGDGNVRNAAERETLEEVGLRLSDAESLGRLDDLRGRGAGAPGQWMVISAFVYHVKDPAPLKPNWEVRRAFWFPLDSLLDSERCVEHHFSQAGAFSFPGILVGEPGRHVVWGLTYRFLTAFFAIAGHPLPER